MQTNLWTLVNTLPNGGPVVVKQEVLSFIGLGKVLKNEEQIVNYIF